MVKDIKEGIADMDCEEAQDEFEVPVQCGKCYAWYDALEAMDGCCPYCGSDEIVGDR